MGEQVQTMGSDDNGKVRQVAMEPHVEVYNKDGKREGIKAITAIVVQEAQFDMTVRQILLERGLDPKFLD